MRRKQTAAQQMAAARKPASRKPASRKPAARGSKPRPRARRSSPRALRMPLLEQRQLDLIGLGLIAVGIFLVFPLCLGWQGGTAGRAASDAIAYLVGGFEYGVPAMIVAGGAIIVLRPVLPTLRPFRAGALCLLLALTLMLAAGTFGVGPGHAGVDAWDDEFVSARGGVVGQALLYATVKAFSMIGAHIIAVFLLLAGVLLLTGASVASVLRATGSGLADTTRAMSRVLPRRPRAPESETEEPDEPPAMQAPEPDEGELIIRSTHVEAPSLDGAQRYPDIFGEPDPDEHAEGEPLEQRSLEPELQPIAEGHDASEDEEQAEAPARVKRSVEPSDLTPQGRMRGSLTDDPEFLWRLPGTDLLKRSSAEQSRPDTAGQERTAGRLVEALGHFGVDSKVVGTVAGPHITRFELRLAPGIKMSKVAQLKDDLAYALAATDIRILAPIPGKTAVGVEVPNQRRRIVQLGDVFQDAPAGWSPLTVWLGKDVAGKAIGADLAKMPHLLVAGTTGAGKSAAINAMLSSVLLRATPHELRLVLIDPKQVELNHYESIPHLLTPVITSPRMAANALQNLVKEMEQRYSIMSLAKTRSLIELNRAREKRGDPPLPYIMCVIDELADLMMVAPADVEDSIIRLAQKARAVGIHLVLATQSPRVDVITGMIKANVPSRIAFSVSSQTDSRVILDQNGAESLLGQGDMLFSPVGTSRLQRIQGAYIDEPQIEALTSFWRRQGEPELREDLLEQLESDDGVPGGTDSDDGFSPDEDALLEDAIRLVVEMGTASTSMLQRRLRLGYTRAGRLIDMLERRAVISGYEGSKPRQVLVGAGDVERFLANLRERVGIAPASATAESPALAEGRTLAEAPAVAVEPARAEPEPIHE
jgi:S-DNA-T family DNA segregation ATPase FtsK/SpoIIIE